MNKPEESPVVDHKMIQDSVVVVVVIIWILTGVLVWKSPARIPIFFSRPYGKEQLASPWWLFLFPIFSLLIYFFGTYVKNRLKSSPISTSMAMWVNLGSVILLLLSEIFIATLIF